MDGDSNETTIDRFDPDHYFTFQQEELLMVSEASDAVGRAARNTRLIGIIDHIKGSWVGEMVAQGDLTIWCGGRLVAVIRRGVEGPCATIFDD